MDLTTEANHKNSDLYLFSRLVPKRFPPRRSKFTNTHTSSRIQQRFLVAAPKTGAVTSSFPFSQLECSPNAQHRSIHSLQSASSSLAEHDDEETMSPPLTFDRLQNAEEPPRAKEQLP